MDYFEKTSRRKPHLEIPKAATELQAVISRGEDYLERAHKVAHEIEEHVRQVMEIPTNSDSHPCVNSPDHFFSNCHARDELARSEVPVDNRRRDR